MSPLTLLTFMKLVPPAFAEPSALVPVRVMRLSASAQMRPVLVLGVGSAVQV